MVGLTVAEAGHVNFDALVDEISPNVRECPPHTVRQHIQRAMVAACEHTQMWRWRQPAMRLTEGVADYQYQPPVGGDISRVLVATLVETVPGADGGVEKVATQLRLVRAEALFSERVAGIPLGWPAVGDLGTPLYIATVSRGRIVVAPAPDDREYDLSLYVSLRPKATVTTMPEEMLDALWEPVYHRTLQSLHTQTGVPWASKESRDYHASQYQFFVNRRHGDAGEIDTVRVVQPRAVI